MSSDSTTRSASYRCILALLLLGVSALPASAQATRTWVSGVGDDANPCSRTAPCKTFAGAISKTATGGEINVLDPGGFGGVTITKSITISSEGFEAGVLVSGTNAIVVNAPANAVVVLRGLDIEGLGTGLNGIRFLAGGALHVEDCTISGFTQEAIEFAPTGTSQLFVSDTIIRKNVGVNAGGILILPGAAGSAQVSIRDTTMRGNTFGMRLEGSTHATVVRTEVSNSAFNGFVAVGSGAVQTVLNLESCIATNNLGNGVRSNGFGAVVRITNTTITDNVGEGLSLSGGSIVSFGNNRVAGNGVDGSPSSTVSEI